MEVAELVSLFFFLLSVEVDGGSLKKMPHD